MSDYENKVADHSNISKLHNEYFRRFIKEKANKIRNGVVGGKLYGFYVDGRDEDIVLVALYYKMLLTNTEECDII